MLRWVILKVSADIEHYYHIYIQLFHNAYLKNDICLYEKAARDGSFFNY